MELATIFLIWLVVTIIDNLAKRKKRRVPPPQNQNDAPDFDIPTIAGDPNFPGEEIPIVLETPKHAEVRPKNPPRPKKSAAQVVRESDDNNALDLPLTPATAMNALIMAEILGKPKALRRTMRNA